MFLPSPQVRLAQFRGSGFADFVLDVFQDNLSRPSQKSLLLLALGWVMTGKQHRLAAYLWSLACQGRCHSVEALQLLLHLFGAQHLPAARSFVVQGDCHGSEDGA